MSEAELQQLANFTSDFLNRHRAPISEIARQNTHIFEAACYVLVARHYEEAGYQLQPENLLDSKFRFRYSTGGYPWNFSYFAVFASEPTEDGNVLLFEIRHNQKVAGAWVDTEEESEDKALFAVDVAVIEGGSLPTLPQGTKRTDEPIWVENKNLITFAEAKKLRAYPMLLAQFFGIVHEVKPEFVRIGDRDISQDFWQRQHPPPTLMTSDDLSEGTKRVLRSFAERNLQIRVVEDVTGLSDEILLSKLRGTAQEDTIEPDE